MMIFYFGKGDKMDNLISFFLLSLTSLFALMNPLNIMPVYIGMTNHLPREKKLYIAKKSTITAFTALIVFALSGQFIFKFFGISVNSFKVAGGCIFFLVGYEMLQAKITRTKIDDENHEEYADDISVTPLAIPMICGPGAITSLIVLMSEAKNYSSKIALLLAIIIIGFSTYAILRYSDKISRILGETGNKVLLRLMGLIIMVIAIELFFSGLKPIIRDIIYLK
jgi:multiple antibiotic resistance protein